MMARTALRSGSDNVAHASTTRVSSVSGGASAALCAALESGKACDVLEIPGGDGVVAAVCKTAMPRFESGRGLFLSLACTATIPSQPLGQPGGCLFPLVSEPASSCPTQSQQFPPRVSPWVYPNWQANSGGNGRHLSEGIANAGAAQQPAAYVRAVPTHHMDELTRAVWAAKGARQKRGVEPALGHEPR